MKNRRSVGAEPYALKIEGNNRGGGRDGTCNHGLYVQKLESRSVPQKKNNKRDDQSAISSKEHVKYEATQTYLPVTYQHDRLHLTGKRPQQRSQGPQQLQSTPSILLRRVFSEIKNTKRCDTGTNACHSPVPSVDTVYLLRPSRGAA